jgi:hypothetical protein
MIQNDTKNNQKYENVYKYAVGWKITKQIKKDYSKSNKGEIIP